MAIDDYYNTIEETALNIPALGVLSNDLDVENNPLTAEKVSDPIHGTLTFYITGAFIYIPDENYNGIDIFTYRAYDGTNYSTIGTVQINITQVNDPPIVNNDYYTTTENTTLNVLAPGVLTNDEDVENNPLTAIKLTEPSNGIITIFNVDGSFTYTPTNNYVGPDSFIYKANDGTNDSNTATVYITITSLNNPPVEEPEEPIEELENQPPIADSGGPYYEIVGVEILFDGSDSYDIDGNSILYNWDFGDGHSATQQTPSYAYQKEGNYTVILTVTDEDGATSSDTTTATITSKPNNPPEKPMINGIKTGHVNISYNFTANASDPDNDKIQYFFNWDDSTKQINSSFMNSNEQFNTSHNWTKGGVYTVTVYTKDDKNATSNTQSLKVLIDAHYCGTLGYLIDKNGDGEYDVFYRETTDKEIPIEKNGDEYNIDINGDEKWDYMYNLITDNVNRYTAASAQGSEQGLALENNWILIIGLICIITSIVFSLIIIKKGNKSKIKSKKEKKKKLRTKSSKKDEIYISDPENKNIKKIHRDIDKLLLKNKK